MQRIVTKMLVIYEIVIIYYSCYNDNKIVIFIFARKIFSKEKTLRKKYIIGIMHVKMFTQCSTNVIII